MTRVSTHILLPEVDEHTTRGAVLKWAAMRRSMRSAGGWCVAVCIAGSLAAWGCGSADTNPFTDEPKGGQSGTSGSSSGGSTSGSDTGGTSVGGSSSGGTSGPSTGGEETGGTSTGGSNGDGGAAADAGAESGGTATGGNGGTDGGGTGGAGMGGTAGTPMGGAGMSGAGIGGAGMAGGGMSGSGGTPGDCKLDSDCDDDEYCKKASCDAASGNCAPLGPDCYGSDATFDPVCGCDGTTFWNTCVLEHAGINAAIHGECAGSDRPSCTRDDGGTTCPSGGDHARCYRPVDVCGDSSPTRGYCWVVPGECPDDEPQTERYCGGTAGSARCIGLCEVIEAENSFHRDSAICD